MKLSVVIPAYNESESISETVETLIKKLSESKIEHEVFVVNDNSKDNTEVVLQGFNSSFKILSSKNSQIENLQEDNTEKSALPNDQDIPVNDLDDEIPF